MSELLPAAVYDVYRKPGARVNENRPPPPLNASPGELRLWQKLHGELDPNKEKEEARIRARNTGMRQHMPTPAPMADPTVVKAGRRAGLRSHSADTNSEAKIAPRRRSTGSTDEKAPADESERASLLSACQARVGGLEKQLRKMADELEAARSEAETQSNAARGMQEQMEAAAKAEQARTAAMGKRMEEVMAAWQASQKEWAQTKAELEAERDAALGRPPEEPLARTVREQAQAQAAESPAPEVQEPEVQEPEPPTPAKSEVYSDDDHDEDDAEEQLEASLP